MASLGSQELVIEKHLESNRMREYSDNIVDSLTYKIRVQALNRNKEEKERVKQHSQSVVKLLNSKKLSGFS